MAAAAAVYFAFALAFAVSSQLQAAGLYLRSEMYGTGGHWHACAPKRSFLCDTDSTASQITVDIIYLHLSDQIHPQAERTKTQKN
eukprot:scaffold35328_cov62-Cyclotella_meneghiniana.AAC.3